MLNKKTILVTGATSGIGAAICQDLLGAGASIVAVGRNSDRLDVLKTQAPSRVKIIRFDLTQFADHKAVLTDIGTIDGLVYSAGITDSNPLRFFSLEKYQKVIDINQTAPIVLVSELVRAGCLNPASSIVFISSILGPRIGMKGTAAYAATKAALTAYAKVMALELAHKSIRVNCVSPGMVNTALITNQHQVSEESLRIDMQKYPLGKRFAEAREVATVVRFLLSDESSFITGTELVADGGYSIQ
ncbi:SDR family oxidoreductase [Dyella jejuensis]|uniref:SDR family oxidoreductase n=1 Tax=Dyella jejuensis TaxID=1432009 RepID=A0ABW8JKR6_9GAMM